MLDFVEGHCCTQTVIPTTNPPLLTLHSHSHSLPLSLTLLKLTSSEFSKPWQIWMNSNETFNIIRHIANFTKPGVNLKSKHRMKTSDIECILYRTQYQFVYTIFKNNFTCPSIVTYSHMWSNLTTHTPTPLTNTHTPLTHPHHSQTHTHHSHTHTTHNGHGPTLGGDGPGEERVGAGYGPTHKQSGHTAHTTWNTLIHTNVVPTNILLKKRLFTDV